MLSVSLDLAKKACMEKAGLKTMSCTIEKLNAETNFPQIFRLKSNGQEYKLYIYPLHHSFLFPIFRLRRNALHGKDRVLLSRFSLYRIPLHTPYSRNKPLCTLQEETLRRMRREIVHSTAPGHCSVPEAWSVP